MTSSISYVHGALDTSLLGETKDQNLDRTAARVPNSPASVIPTQGVHWIICSRVEGPSR